MKKEKFDWAINWIFSEMPVTVEWQKKAVEAWELNFLEEFPYPLDVLLLDTILVHKKDRALNILKSAMRRYWGLPINTEPVIDAQTRKLIAELNTEAKVHYFCREFCTRRKFAELVWYRDKTEIHSRLVLKINKAIKLAEGC